jgi:hypothetical protein
MTTAHPSEAIPAARAFDAVPAASNLIVDRRARPAPPAAKPVRRGRSVAGYLVMPRPGDAVKALLMPLTFGLGVLAGGGTDGRTLVRALLMLVVLEFLIYPARYQWNDVRGFAADQRHPGGSDRGRLPGPLSMARSRIIASSAVAALRLAVAGLVGFLPGLDLGGAVIAVFVGVFGVAAAYEALRATVTGKHGGAGPPPLSAGLIALWITVGAGYVVRGMTGLGLAVGLREQPGLSVAAAVTLWAYGVAFVTSRWAVESIAFAELDGERVTWSADASHAREHLLALTRWLPSSAPAHVRTGPRDASLDRWDILRGRTPATAPWNLAVSLAGAGATATGWLLTVGEISGAAWSIVVAGTIASLAVALLPRYRLEVLIASAAALFVVLTTGGTAQPLVALLPWLTVMTAYVHFSGQCLATMGSLGRVVRGAVGRALCPLARLAVGHHTWQVLSSSGVTHG